MHPPCTPLGYLFLRAHAPGKTTYSESGIKVSLVKREGETILFFRTDEEMRRKAEDGSPVENFASHFDIQSGESRADVMLLYIKRGEGDNNVIRLVVMELKGKDHAHAVRQLDRTLDALKSKLTPLLGSDFFTPSTLRALIISKTSSQQQSNQERLEFQKKWGFPAKICFSGKEPELRKHLD